MKMIWNMCIVDVDFLASSFLFLSVLIFLRTFCIFGNNNKGDSNIFLTLTPKHRKKAFVSAVDFKCHLFFLAIFHL